MMKRPVLAMIVLAGLLGLPFSVAAASYSFSMPTETVQVYWNSDGTEAIDYTFTLQNDPGAAPIDVIDIGLPNSNYDLGSITAEVNGSTVGTITQSDVISVGVSLWLGNLTIAPGSSGDIHMFVPRVSGVLYPDDNDANYASAVFSPNWFDSQYVHGSTYLSVVFHLPPGVQPDQPRYHTPSGNWPGSTTPGTGLDNQGRPQYTWSSPDANASTQYTFGASFPKSVVPASAITTLTAFDRLGILLAGIGTTIGDLMPCLCVCGTFVFIIGLSILGAYSSNQRKKQYLPPKISIEGHGIKRGLTAVEAALLQEEPLDKVMTMVLFGVIKKNAATVTSRDPLTLQVAQPISDQLNPYEQDFLKAFQIADTPGRRKALQDMTVAMIKSLQEKMKGFSRKETVDYYKSITENAWQQVTAAGTPDVKAQALDDNLEWTMLDRNFNTRSQEVWGSGPVYVPIWWGRYSPGYAPAAPAMPGHSFGPTQVSLPHLPGSDFAASVVGGVQNFSSKVIGDVTGFTSRVTDKTNPVPVSSSSGGWHSGGGGCACACACAGCACACAGGGR